MSEIVGSCVRLDRKGSVYEILEDNGDFCKVQGMFEKSMFSTSRLYCNECDKKIRNCTKCKDCDEYHCDGKCQVCEYCDGTGVTYHDEYENGQCVGIGTLDEPCICKGSE